MSEYILVCSCFHMDKRASEAFCTMFPNVVLPDIIRGRDRISKLAKKLNNDHIDAISKLASRYAFYIKMEGEKIIEEYNLLTGKRIS